MREIGSERFLQLNRIFKTLYIVEWTFGNDPFVRMCFIIVLAL